MSAQAYLVVNVDTDPDPVSIYQDDRSILAKYHRMREIIVDGAEGKAAWTILTGPLYRNRFSEAPFVEFWNEAVAAGGNLVLHPEEDLYGPPLGAAPGACSYYNAEHMRDVILSQATKLRQQGLDFHAFRGGYHGFTPAMGDCLKQAGIGIDLSCAPGVVWPEKAANWAQAPLSAYYMSGKRQDSIADSQDIAAILEIPWAWDGEKPGTSKPFVVGDNYMINEFSTLDAMKRVWKAVVDRSEKSGTSQIVSMICHTFTMGRSEYEERLMAILAHVAAQGGKFVTPTEARMAFKQRNVEPVS